MANKRSLEKTAIQWHPAFLPQHAENAPVTRFLYGAAELELRENKEDLEFHQEYNLSKEPLRVDLLVIEKRTDVQVKNEIGHIFRKYNVIEYKSPDDGLTIDDFYKTVGYACLYKGLGGTVDAVPVGELTLSLFREGYPAEMFRALGRLGVKVERHYPGIYYIHGWKAMPATQIVVTKKLRGRTHRALKVLSKHVTEEDARGFVEEASRLTEPGDRDNVDAVMDATVAANKDVYEKIRREDPFMCEALRELMKDEIESEIAERERIAALEARQETSQEIRQETIKNLMDSMKWTAEQAMEAMKIPVEDRERYMAGL